MSLSTRRGGAALLPPKPSPREASDSDDDRPLSALCRTVGPTMGLLPAAAVAGGGAPPGQQRSPVFVAFDRERDTSTASGGSFVGPLMETATLQLPMVGRRTSTSSNTAAVGTSGAGSRRTGRPGSSGPSPVQSLNTSVAPEPHATAGDPADLPRPIIAVEPPEGAPAPVGVYPATSAPHSHRGPPADVEATYTACSSVAVSPIRHVPDVDVTDGGHDGSSSSLLEAGPPGTQPPHAAPRVAPQRRSIDLSCASSADAAVINGLAGPGPSSGPGLMGGTSRRRDVLPEQRPLAMARPCGNVPLHMGPPRACPATRELYEAYFRPDVVAEYPVDEMLWRARAGLANASGGGMEEPYSKHRHNLRNGVSWRQDSRSVDDSDVWYVASDHSASSEPHDMPSGRGPSDMFSVVITPAASTSPLPAPRAVAAQPSSPRSPVKDAYRSMPTGTQHVSANERESFWRRRQRPRAALDASLEVGGSPNRQAPAVDQASNSPNRSQYRSSDRNFEAGEAAYRFPPRGSQSEDGIGAVGRKSGIEDFPSLRPQTEGELGGHRSSGSRASWDDGQQHIEQRHPLARPPSLHADPAVTTPSISVTTTPSREPSATPSRALGSGRVPSVPAWVSPFRQGSFNMQIEAADDDERAALDALYARPSHFVSNHPQSPRMREAVASSDEHLFSCWSTRGHERAVAASMEARDRARTLASLQRIISNCEVEERRGREQIAADEADARALFALNFSKAIAAVFASDLQLQHEQRRREIERQRERELSAMMLEFLKARSAAMLSAQLREELAYQVETEGWVRREVAAEEAAARGRLWQDFASQRARLQFAELADKEREGRRVIELAATREWGTLSAAATEAKARLLESAWQRDQHRRFISNRDRLLDGEEAARAELERQQAELFAQMRLALFEALTRAREEALRRRSLAEQHAAARAEAAVSESGRRLLIEQEEQGRRQQLHALFAIGRELSAMATRERVLRAAIVAAAAKDWQLLQEQAVSSRKEAVQRQRVREEQEKLRRIREALLARARRARPFIGMALAEKVVDGRRQGEGDLVVDALYVGGPAHKKGISLNDTVVNIGGEPATSLLQVRQAIAKRAIVGDELVVVIRKAPREKKRRPREDGGASDTSLNGSSSFCTESIPSTSNASTPRPRSPVVPLLDLTSPPPEEADGLLLSASESARASFIERTIVIPVMTADEQFSDLVDLYFDLSKHHQVTRDTDNTVMLRSVCSFRRKQQQIEKSPSPQRSDTGSSSPTQRLSDGPGGALGRDDMALSWRSPSTVSGEAMTPPVRAASALHVKAPTAAGSRKSVVPLSGSLVARKASNLAVATGRAASHLANSGSMRRVGSQSSMASTFE